METIVLAREKGARDPGCGSSGRRETLWNCRKKVWFIVLSRVDDDPGCAEMALSMEGRGLRGLRGTWRAGRRKDATCLVHEGEAGRGVDAATTRA